jgi:hypothetical protein
MEYISTSQDKREKIQALPLADECYSMKLDLFINATVVNDAIRFVSEQQQKNPKDRIRLSSNNNENNIGSEFDYDEPREINYTTITTNEVF